MQLNTPRFFDLNDRIVQRLRHSEWQLVSRKIGQPALELVYVFRNADQSPAPSESDTMTNLRPIVFLLALSACTTDPFTQIGYFKDDNLNRVFQIVADAEVKPEAARAHLERRMHTDGRFTVAVIYEANTEARDVVTLAPDYMSAIDAIHDGPGRGWRWRMATSATGDQQFTDCTVTPDDDLCEAP